MQVTTPLAIGLALAALIAAGCGDDETTTEKKPAVQSATPTTTTK